MEDKRKNNGGHKTNGGRHTKADEAKVNTLFVEGLKRLYNKDTDDENKISFVVTLLLNIYLANQKKRLKQH